MTKEHEKRSPESEASVDKRHDHERIDALMPWIKRGELEDAESDLVTDELAKSPAFQAKLAQEGDLAAALGEIAADEAEINAADADAAWTKFKTRLPSPKANAPEDAPPQAHPTPRQRASSPARISAWRRFRLPQTSVGWLATAQTAVLAALAFLFIPGQIATTDQEYRTLSSDEVATALPAGNAVVMIDPATDLATLQEILSEAGARIVDGPMANGGYVIAVDKETFSARLEALRSNEAVILVEPLSAEAQP